MLVFFFSEASIMPRHDSLLRYLCNECWRV